MQIIVTGAAGFIGFHLTKRLLDLGHSVIAIDNINDYYDVNLKYARLKELGIDKKNIDWHIETSSSKYPKLQFIKLDLQEFDQLSQIFTKHKINQVCHLAAQAGVRHSLKAPRDYINSNLVGFFNILELSKFHEIKHFVYASSSSVYGLREDMPLRESDRTDHPISLYAATKKSNELIAHTYSHLYNLPTTGLRFFTVYGPWGRPDMAPMLFADAILNNREINVFNHGQMMRDFTYIDDIVNGIEKAMNCIPSINENWSKEIAAQSSPIAPYQIFNIGNSRPIQLLDFIKAIESELGIEAKKKMMEMQAGDVLATYSETTQLINKTSYKANFGLEEGVKLFVKWFLAYSKHNT